jgi:type I restriction enzyme S subunit
MIQSDGIQEQIRLLSKQTAQANLFLGAIASLMIPLPSIEEQNELVERLDTLLFKMQQSKEIAEQAIDQINTLKKVILARAFRGELGTNDPKDESAVELLKSIL